MLIQKSWLIHKMCILVLQDSVHKLGSETLLFLARKIIYADLAEMENIFIKRFTS
jgi:hypothetical protein